MEHFSVFGHVNQYPHTCALSASPSPLVLSLFSHFFPDPFGEGLCI